MRSDFDTNIITPIQSGDSMSWEDLREPVENLQNNRHIICSEHGVLFTGFDTALYPLAGWASANALESTVNPFVVPVTIPSGVTRYNVLAHLYMIDDGTRVSDVKVELTNLALPHTQTLYHPFASGAGAAPEVNVGTGDLHVNYQGFLDANLQPRAGEVIEGEITVTPNMANPQDRGHANTYYSGLLQLTVVLY